MQRRGSGESLGWDGLYDVSTADVPLEGGDVLFVASFADVGHGFVTQHNRILRGKRHVFAPQYRNHVL